MFSVTGVCDMKDLDKYYSSMTEVMVLIPIMHCSVGLDRSVVNQAVFCVRWSNLLRHRNRKSRSTHESKGWITAMFL